MDVDKASASGSIYVGPVQLDPNHSERRCLVMVMVVVEGGCAGVREVVTKAVLVSV